jgi:colicin import membrane protein
VIWLKDELRKPGMPLSLGLHAAVLVAGVVSFSNPKPFSDAQEAIAVEVIDASALREVMKGEQQAKPQPTPAPRVDRVDDKKEQNAPGEAKRQVTPDVTPKPQEATAKEERKEQAAAVVPPPLLPRIVPPAPPKPADPPKPVAAKPPKPAESAEEEDDAEEIVRQAARKKAEEQKKLEDQRRAEERRKAEEQKRQEDARKQEQQRQELARAEQQKQDQQKREQQDEARQRAEQKKIADAQAAEDRKKTEDAKKAQEAAKKAAEERRKRESDQETKNQATAEAARRALLASRETPQNSGNTGQQVSRTPAQGTPAATGQKLNPAERGQLIGMLADQIRACWNVPVSGKPSVLPQVRMVLNQDGSLGAQPVLVNSSGDPLFRAVAESGMRAIRQCSPFRIPARFAPMYGDWRSTIVQLNPDD